MTVEVAVAVELTRAEAQRQFCEREYAALARYCWRLVGDEQQARDVTQEAFVRLFGRWTAAREPRAYLYLTATNIARRTWRRRRSEERALSVAYPRGVEPAVDGPDPGIRAVVESLPRRWRDPVLLHYFADLPVSEVARQLGEPDGTVKRRLSEARALLADRLREYR